MSASTTTRSATSREQMDALVDGHYRAEENGDLAAIINGFAPGAEHDVVGRPGDALYGGEQIAGFYGALLAELRIDRFEPVAILSVLDVKRDKLHLSTSFQATGPVSLH